MHHAEQCLCKCPMWQPCNFFSQVPCSPVSNKTREMWQLQAVYKPASTFLILKLRQKDLIWLRIGHIWDLTSLGIFKSTCNVSPIRRLWAMQVPFQAPISNLSTEELMSTGCWLFALWPAMKKTKRPDVSALQKAVAWKGSPLPGPHFMRFQCENTNHRANLYTRVFTHKQTSKQTIIQANKQTNKQKTIKHTYRQTDDTQQTTNQTNRQANRQTDNQTYTQTY